MRSNISFCTTVYNRYWQLLSTFDENADLIAAEDCTEWLIVDFGSTDGAIELLFEKLRKHPRGIRFFSESSGRPWHSSYAKNVAHRLAAGQILMNLDCDNFVRDAISTIRRYFSEGVAALHMSSGIARDGTTGRIAVTRDAFSSVGGYDESLLPMGYQDYDFLARLAAAGHLVARWNCAPGTAILNSKDDSIEYCRRGSMTWADYDRYNREISAANIAAGKLVANCGQWHAVYGAFQNAPFILD